MVQTFFRDMKPVCLYTYETAMARKIFVDCKPDYNDMRAIVTKFFGNHSMDNKITMVFKDMHGSRVYYTYWDGKLSIGGDVTFLADLSKSYNKYRTILPIES